MELSNPRNKRDRHYLGKRNHSFTCGIVLKKKEREAGRETGRQGQKDTSNKLLAASDKLGCEKVEVLFEQNTTIKDGKLANSNVM